MIIEHNNGANNYVAMDIVAMDTFYHCIPLPPLLPPGLPGSACRPPASAGFQDCPVLREDMEVGGVCPGQGGGSDPPWAKL